MYRFGQAAYAIGVKEAALRNWFTRNKVDLFEARPTGGWRTFTENDVFVLAVAVELIRFGAPVTSAVAAVRAALAGMNFQTMQGMPSWLFAAPFPADKQLGDVPTLWCAKENESLVVAQTASRSIVKIAVPPCMADARRRLSEIGDTKGAADGG